MLANSDRQFGTLITRLIQKENLSQTEAKQAFSVLLCNQTTEMQQGAFLAALTSKGETAEEVAGAWEAIYHLDTNKARLPEELDLIDNCGTGMDTLKTFNISTGASLLAAAAQIPMARHGARAITSPCGTVDLAEALGVDVECSVELVAQSIQKASIGLFNGMSALVHPQALFRILSQISFGSTLNIAASLANPALPKIAVRGVYNKALLKPVARVMAAIGYKQALVIYGSVAGSKLGMDEASVCGPTFCTELRPDGQMCTYSFTPADFGLNTYPPQELAPACTIQEEAKTFVRLLQGKGSLARQEAVILNAALIYYLSGKCKDIARGVKQAKENLYQSKGFEALCNWITTQNKNPEQAMARVEALLRG